MIKEIAHKNLAKLKGMDFQNKKVHLVPSTMDAKEIQGQEPTRSRRDLKSLQVTEQVTKAGLGMAVARTL